VRVKLTDRGQEIRAKVDKLYDRQMQSIQNLAGFDADEFQRINKALVRLERFWTDQILYRM